MSPVWVASTEIGLARGMCVLSVLWAHIYKALDRHEQHVTHENHRHRLLMAAKAPSNSHAHLPIAHADVCICTCHGAENQPKKRQRQMTLFDTGSANEDSTVDNGGSTEQAAVDNAADRLATPAAGPLGSNSEAAPLPPSL